MLQRLFLAVALLACSVPSAAQELPEGQGEAEYQAWLASSPGVRGQVLSFEAWQEAAGVRGVLPTWQMLRTASMWRECGGQPFEVPPHSFWPDMVRTLRFIRDHVRAALGPVQAVSGYRNPALNHCARGSARSAHLDFFALDLVPETPIERGELFRRLCAMHARHGRSAEAGLGFYSFQRFHVDSRGFRRWGSAGPRGNESPCAVIERGGDPLAAPPPVTMPPPPAAGFPAVRPPTPGPPRLEPVQAAPDAPRPDLP
ncbi:D-Ala-D-Ala carboxypeptidase family metallohydrolase [Sphingosinicella sp. CPCC 101087]|uniref:D-Ala-D-Ala carboxypeptidase family metallohydrolase n=1 Tax=Sphingosinicella sp. CPCC 101087 TaxID=2497754 RepID=UPI00101B902F|nr:D-Ala-D-Ala carboxypeptidase family metallohydrolase [Sphingosinicella sp. CPCC 101087]